MITLQAMADVDGVPQPSVCTQSSCQSRLAERALAALRLYVLVSKRAPRVRSVAVLTCLAQGASSRKEFPGRTTG